MNSWFEDQLFWTCLELRLQRNLCESTIGHWEIIQWTLPRSALCRQKLFMLLEFLKGCALCTICRRNAQRAAILYSVRERVLHWILVKKILNMELSTAVNGQSQRAECWLEWTLVDHVCVCVCVVGYRVVCASCFSTCIKANWFCELTIQGDYWSK